MSLPETARMKRSNRILRLTGAAALLLIAAGCTVQPLYGDRSTASAPGASAMGSELASVSVSPASDRITQEVRNHLLFLLYGGAAEPTQPRYRLDLTTSVAATTAAAIQIERDQEPTAAVITVTANYVIRDTATGQPIATGSRRIASPYDVPRQQFAALRAERDAQNRASREVAELVRMAVAQELSKR